MARFKCWSMVKRIQSDRLVYVDLLLLYFADGIRIELLGASGTLDVANEVEVLGHPSEECLVDSCTVELWVVCDERERPIKLI